MSRTDSITSTGSPRRLVEAVKTERVAELAAGAGRAGAAARREAVLHALVEHKIDALRALTDADTRATGGGRVEGGAGG